MSAYAVEPYSEARAPGPLSVQHIDRYRTTFAVGTEAWVYVRPEQVRDARRRMEETGTETVLLATYWLDEQDLAALL